MPITSKDPKGRFQQRDYNLDPPEHPGCKGGPWNPGYCDDYPDDARCDCYEFCRDHPDAWGWTACTDGGPAKICACTGNMGGMESIPGMVECVLAHEAIHDTECESSGGLSESRGY